ncbi:MAG: O-antigen ligase family protein [Chthoniobacterales bacterium]
MIEKSGKFSAVTEGLSLLILCAAFAIIQVLIGGTRMVFSLPAYALIGVAGFFAIFSWRRIKPRPSEPCLAVTAIFFGYIIGRALLSPVPYIARSDLYSVLGGLVVYFLVSCTVIGAKPRLILVTVLLALAMGHVAVGAIQFRDGTNFMPISWLQRYDYERRASGFYICPNHLAGLLEVVGVMGLSVVCWSRWPVWGKLVIAYLVGVCYVGLILTGSRGGYLSTAASLLVFGLLSLLILRRASGGIAWKIGLPAVVLALLVGVAVVFYVGKNDFLKQRAQTTFDTSNMRVELWKAALQQWQLQPVVGTGSATYLYYGRLFRDKQVQLDPIYTHGDYLQLLAEYGLVGAIGMAIFIGVHLRNGLRNFARLGPRRVTASQLLPSNALALNVGAIAAVSSYLVHSIFDFNLHIPANVLLMALVFGILANEGVMREKLAGNPLAQKVWRLAAAALSLVLLGLSLRLLPGEYFSERARMAVRDHQPGLALLFARKGLDYDPANPDLYHHLASAQMQFGDGAGAPEAAASFQRAAIAALEHARAIAPRELIYGLELAGALDSAGRFDEAEKVFQDLIRLDPKSDSLARYHQGHLKLQHPEKTEKIDLPATGS